MEGDLGTPTTVGSLSGQHLLFVALLFLDKVQEKLENDQFCMHLAQLLGGYTELKTRVSFTRETLVKQCFTIVQMPLLANV